VRPTRRIVFVVNHAGFFLSHRLPLALAARDAGYEVVVATPKSKHVPRILAAGLRWEEFRMSRSGMHPLRELLTLFDIRRLYRRLAPDLVHHVSSKPVLYGTLLARLNRVPAVVNAISGLGGVFAGGESRLMQNAIKAAYAVMLRHPHMKVIFQNDEQRDAFVSRGWLREEQTILIRGSGVDLMAFAPGERSGAAVPLVVFASRMLKTKGVEDMVAAARLLRARGVQVRVALVGEPDPDNPRSVTAETLRGWAVEGIVEYRGRSEDMPAVFREADIVAFPSYYAEGVPKVLLEAAASGLPVVTTDWPGCRDVVQDGVNGLLVPVRDPEALANAIAALATDPERRRAMGRAAREKAVAQYSVDAVIAETLEIYRELLR
jgi:glycosyltransferase involved in cell wall biosynthesis